MCPLLCYEAISYCAILVLVLVKMMGKFCITCMVGNVNTAVVIRLDFMCRNHCGAASRNLAGQFEGRSLRRRMYNKLLRPVGVCTASGKRSAMLPLLLPPDATFDGVHAERHVPAADEAIEMFGIGLHHHLHEQRPLQTFDKATTVLLLRLHGLMVIVHAGVVYTNEEESITWWHAMVSSRHAREQLLGTYAMPLLQDSMTFRKLVDLTISDTALSNGSG